MKKWWPILLLFCLPARAQEITRVPASALDALLQHADTALVVNMWATWCGPCVKEIPHFEKLSREMKDRKVKFIFLSLDMEDAYPQKIRQFVRRYKLRSSIAWLDEPNANKYAEKIDKRWEGSIPATLFINTRKGYRRFVEGMITEAQLQEEIRKMMD